MAELLFRLQSAPGHEAVSNAHAGGIPEGHPDVVFIVLFQEGAVNDVDDLPTVILPVLSGQCDRSLFQLLRHHVGVCAIAVLQRIMDGIHVPVFHHPGAWPQGIGTFPGITYIKDVPDAGNVTSVVDQGNAFRSPADITPLMRGFCGKPNSPVNCNEEPFSRD